MAQHGGGAQLWSTASLLLILSALGASHACVFTYARLGNDSSLDAAQQKGQTWDYAYFGMNWKGQDQGGAGWACLTGQAQSPIDVSQLDGLPAIPEEAQTNFTLGTLQSNGTGDVMIVNTGHTVQVEWQADPQGLDASIVVLDGLAPAPSTPLYSVLQSPSAPAGATMRRVPVRPRQFHFHTPSEHTIGGAQYGLELHIVTSVQGLEGCPGTLGCLAVFGVMLRVDPSLESDQGTPFEDVLRMLPNQTMEKVNFTAGWSLSFDKLLPQDRTYITYAGSLTTPPCTESVLWHLFTTPMAITMDQYERFLVAIGSPSECKPLNATAVDGDVNIPEGADTVCSKLRFGDNHRMVQGLHGRTVAKYSSPQPPQPPQPGTPPHHLSIVPLPTDSKTAAEDGAIVGAVLGSLVGGIVFTCVAIFLYKRYERKVREIMAARQWPQWPAHLMEGIPLGNGVGGAHKDGAHPTAGRMESNDEARRLMA